MREKGGIEEVNGIGGDKGEGASIPFFKAFCFSALRWAAAGFMARSLSFAIILDDLSVGNWRMRLIGRCVMEREVDDLRGKMHEVGQVDHVMHQPL